MKIEYRLLLFFLASLFVIACDTDVESKFRIDGIETGKEIDESYLQNLRAFKATMHDRKISFCWFGGWNGEGAFMKTSLAGLPDSLDVVSLWDGWKSISAEMKKDLEYVQKVRGTRVVGCDLIGNIGKGYTPDDADFDEYWGWEGELSPADRNEVPTEVQASVIRKYARAIAENINELGLDGYDIDYEVGYGSKGNLVEYYYRMLEFVDELGKYFGPKSGTDKLLIIDGAIKNIPKETAPYFNWFVIQAYRASSNAALNRGDNRFSTAIDNLAGIMEPEEIAPKIVMAEEYEQGQSATGGVKFTLDDGTQTNSLKGMALWQPQYNNISYPRSGGCGVYHVEYEYDITTATNGYTGFYPWIREAIQTMNPSPRTNH